MTNIYFVDYCGDYGEAQGFYDENGKLLDYWYSNDGEWRGEYFDGFLRELGIKVVYSNKFDKEFEELLKEDY